MLPTPFRQVFRLTALACCLLAAAPAAGATRQARVRVGSAPELPNGAQTAGSLAEDRELALVVGLEPRDPAALARFAEAVSTPGSPQFRQYLGVGDFAARFAPSEAQIATVRGALEAQGLAVGPTPANHLILPVTGTSAEIEAAFATPLERVLLPATASDPERVAYANAEPPAIVGAAAPYVQGVVGLDDLTRFESNAEAHPPTGGPMPCQPIAEAHEWIHEGWSADRIATAYGFTQLYAGGDLGAGQSVGLLELQPYSTADIAAYQSCYGTSTEVTDVNLGGGPKPNGGDDMESALDIEQVIGLAPKARVLVYQAPREGAGDIEALTAMVSQNLAKSLSTSWGACEGANAGTLYSIEDTLLEEAAAQGQSFFAAAGDDGSEDCIKINKSTAAAVDDPASQPFATGVGGTTLSAAQLPPTESIWNEGPKTGLGTGGGVSALWAMPAYQSGAAAPLGVVNPLSSGAPCAAALCREVPDVSADAAVRTGYYIYAEGEWTVIGGTSASAPLWAAFAALANAGPACAARPIGFVNPAIYQLGGSAYAANFNDVTAPSPSGLASNDVHFNGTRPFPVGPGYDMATGVGTPIGGALAASLCSLAAPAFSVGVTGPGNQSSLVGTAVALPVAAHQSAGLPLTYTAAGLPPGLAIDPKTGVVAGTPTVGGVSNVTVSVADQFGDTAATQFSWTVAATHVLRAHLTGLAKRHPKLVFSVAALPGAKLRSLLVNLPPGLEPNRNSHAVRRGVSVRGGGGKRIGSKATPAFHALKIRLGRPSNTANVKAAFPALIAGVQLVKEARHHGAKSLPLTVSVSEAPKRSSSLSLTLEPH